jgi:hypothetical protein
MGLTMKCARCHSHKYDPIPQRDYYRLLDVFKGAYDEHDWVPPLAAEKYGRSFGFSQYFLNSSAETAAFVADAADREGLRQPPWRGHSCLPCRDSSPWMVTATDPVCAPHQLRTV